MSDPFRSERIANWVSDFCEGPELRRFPPAVQEVAGPVLERFLVAACSRRDAGPDEVAEADVRSALTKGLAQLDLPRDMVPHVSDLVATFLSGLESEGRLAGGRALGSFVRARRRLYEDAAGPAVRPIRREATKLGPNDPCPCGSGRKYKKCCARLGRK